MNEYLSMKETTSAPLCQTHTDSLVLNGQTFEAISPVVTAS